MRITKELSELVGIIIGDGNIYYKKSKRKYFVEITGNKEEIEYYTYISNLFKSIINKPGNIKVKENFIRIRVYSKNFTNFLISELKLHPHKGKHLKIKIPDKVLSSKFCKECLRGIFDTDGSYFLSKKSHTNKYPCIEITTSSKLLSNQLISILKNDFRVRIRKSREVYRISLNGKEQTEKWFKQIGSSNSAKLNKFETFKNENKVLISVGR